jgi:DNA adenine methylase
MNKLFTNTTIILYVYQFMLLFNRFGKFFYHLIKNKKNLSFTSFLFDTNYELINAYNIIKDNLDELITSLFFHQKLYYDNPFDYYYKLRSTLPENTIEKASRFIALNKTCFNGLYRVNRSGLFNVPMGKFKKSPTL